MAEDQAADSLTGDGDPVPVDVVTGEADANSPTGRKRREAHRLALNAKETGNPVALFSAYVTAVEERARTEEMWSQSLKALMGDTPPPVTLGPVEAIRDVALAAIKLATDVVLKAQGAGHDEHAEGN